MDPKNNLHSRPPPSNPYEPPKDFEIDDQAKIYMEQNQPHNPVPPPPQYVANQGHYGFNLAQAPYLQGQPVVFS